MIILTRIYSKRFREGRLIVELYFQVKFPRLHFISMADGTLLADDLIFIVLNGEMIPLIPEAQLSGLRRSWKC